MAQRVLSKADHFRAFDVLVLGLQAMQESGGDLQQTLLALEAQSGAVELLRSMAPEGPSRGSELARAYRELSVLVQRRPAHLLRPAQGDQDSLLEQHGGWRRA